MYKRQALRQERAEWDRLSGKEKREQSSVPLQIYGKAKKAAIDLRLVDSSLPDEPVSKANKAVENIYDRWEENRDNKAAQIVFCDNFKRDVYKRQPQGHRRHVGHGGKARVPWRTGA